MTPCSKYVSNFKTLLFLAVGVFFASALLARGFKYKEIEFSKPKYLGRQGKQWERHGRIVGEVKKPTETYTIEIRKTSAGDPILTEKHYGFLSIYETAFLPPGKYHLTVKAEGYIDQRLDKLEVKAGADCVLNIIFGTTVYEK